MIFRKVGQVVLCLARTYVHVPIIHIFRILLAGFSVKIFWNNSKNTNTGVGCDAKDVIAIGQKYGIEIYYDCYTS